MIEESTMRELLLRFTYADWFLLGVILLSAAYGLARGGVNEVFATLTWVGAILISALYYSEVSPYLFFITNPLIADIAGGAILFLLVVVAGGYASLGATRFLHYTGLSGTDHLLGAIFGIARGLLVVGLIYLGMGYLPLVNETWWANSFIVEHLEALRATGAAAF